MAKKAFLILKATPGNRNFLNVGGTFAATKKGAQNNIQKKVDSGLLPPGFYSFIPTEHLHTFKATKTKK